MKKIKIFNDPIYGFIKVKKGLILDLIQDPYFQRLRRISQMGLSYLVYPGAHHTRFQHSLGAMHLMQQSIDVLRQKEVEITPLEEEGLLIGILLHDLGHGPFSHALEGQLVLGADHESVSLRLMMALNDKYDGHLDLAIQMFKGSYHKSFMNQLIASQLDMDRMDFLKRDSFYSGVAEGNINVDRLISMLNVVDNRLVVEEKGLYSAEKFILARRFMYWQVYLHKTGVAAENILGKIIQRARTLLAAGASLPGMSPALRFFLDPQAKGDSSHAHFLENFTSMDDSDLQQALKQWVRHEDHILSLLSNAILQRDLPRILMQDEVFDPQRIDEVLQQVAQSEGLSQEEAGYLVYAGTVKNTAYKGGEQGIHIAMKNGEILDLAEASSGQLIKALQLSREKNFLSYPKKL